MAVQRGHRPDPQARRRARAARSLAVAVSAALGLSGAAVAANAAAPRGLPAAPLTASGPPAADDGAVPEHGPLSPQRHSSDGVAGPLAAAFPRGTRRVLTRQEIASYTVVPGVTYRKWKETDQRGPVRAHLVTVDLDEPGVSLDYATRPRVRQRGALTALLRRDEAVAGVNGDFFDVNDTGAPIGVGVDRGRGRHAPVVNWNNAFVVDRAGVAAIGEPRLVATVRGRPGIVITNVNSPVVRVQGIGMYTSSWGRTAGRGVVDGAPRGSLRQVVVRGGKVVSTSRRLSEGARIRGRLFVGRGAGARALAGLSRGDRVRLRWQVEGRPRVAIGGNLVLLRDGVPQVSDDGQLHPRTAVGVDRDTGDVLLLVVDGRQQASRGHTLLELAEMMRDLGAEDALNLDGGGSSTLAALTRAGELTVKNTPSSGGVQRPVPNGLGVVYSP